MEKDRKETADRIGTNAIDINCYRDLKICVEATASLAKGTLSANTVIYDIDSWTSARIHTKPSAEPCGRRPAEVLGEFKNGMQSSAICTTPGVVERMYLELPRLSL